MIIIVCGMKDDQNTSISDHVGDISTNNLTNNIINDFNPHANIFVPSNILIKVTVVGLYPEDELTVNITQNTSTPTDELRVSNDHPAVFRNGIPAEWYTVSVGEYVYYDSSKQSFSETNHNFITEKFELGDVYECGINASIGPKKKEVHLIEKNIGINIVCTKKLLFNKASIYRHLDRLGYRAFNFPTHVIWLIITYLHPRATPHQNYIQLLRTVCHPDGSEWLLSASTIDILQTLQLWNPTTGFLMFDTQTRGTRVPDFLQFDKFPIDGHGYISSQGHLLIGSVIPRLPGYVSYTIWNLNTRTMCTLYDINMGNCKLLN